MEEKGASQSENDGKKPASEKTNIGDSIGETSAANQSIGVIKLNKNQSIIVELLRQNPYLTGTELAEAIGISKRNIEENIKKIKEMGILVRNGSDRKGYWEVVDRQ